MSALDELDEICKHEPETLVQREVLRAVLAERAPAFLKFARAMEKQVESYNPFDSTGTAFRFADVCESYLQLLADLEARAAFERAQEDDNE